MIRILQLLMISVWPWLLLSEALPESAGEAGAPADSAPSGSHQEEKAPPRKSTLEIPRSPIAGVPFHDAVEIYQRHRKELEQLPGVSAVGLSTEGIFVSTTTPSNLPAQVEGIPIKVVPADHPGVSCGPETHWHVTVGRCRWNVPRDVRRAGRQPPPPPPGVIILRPGGEREQADVCPRGFEEQDYAGWRFCLDQNQPEPIPHLWEPPVAGIPYEEALKILERHQNELMRLPGVTSVGLGDEGITVETDNPEVVPPSVEGLPIITRPSQPPPVHLNHTISQPIRPLHGAVWTRDNLSPGLGGTLTGVVLSEGKPWLVFPAHILFRCDQTSNCPPPSGFPPPPGSSVLNSCSHYAGYGAGGSSPYDLLQPVQGLVDIVGFIQRWDPTPGTSNPAGTSIPSADVAAAFLDNNTTEGNGSLAVDRVLEDWGAFHGGAGVPSTSTVNGQNQVHFVTSDPQGSGFHVLPARVYDINRSLVVRKRCPSDPSGGLYQTQYAQTFLEATDFCFLSGDSGSPVMDRQGRIVGMVNWAHEPPNSCLGGGTNANTIQRVLGFDRWYGTSVNDNTYAVFRGSEGRWYVDNGDGRWTGTSGDITFQFGSNGDFPITGNWNGGSVKCLGVYRPSTRQFFIGYNCNGTWDGTPADKMFTMGIAEDRPLAGDWDGNGIDQVGLYRSSVGWFYLENGNFTWDGCGGTGETCFGPYGITGDLPVGGNWPGSIQNGSDKVGLYRRSNKMWYLEAHANNAWNGCGGGELCKGPFGLNTDWPVAGNWTGVGNTDKIGVYHHNGQGIVPNHTWVLDNGDYIFTDFQREQKLGPYGVNGDLPATWRKSTRKAN